MEERGCEPPPAVSGELACRLLGNIEVQTDNWSGQCCSYSREVMASTGPGVQDAPRPEHALGIGLRDGATIAVATASKWPASRNSARCRSWVVLSPPAAGLRLPFRRRLTYPSRARSKLCLFRQTSAPDAAVSSSLQSGHRSRHTRGMDHVRLYPVRLEPARQPKAAAAGFEGKRNPRDSAAGPDRLIPPAMQQGQAAVLGSAPASCTADAQSREAHRQPASSTGSARRRQ